MSVAVGRIARLTLGVVAVFLAMVLSGCAAYSQSDKVVDAADSLSNQDLDATIAYYEELFKPCAVKLSDRCANVIYTLGGLYYVQAKKDQTNPDYSKSLKMYNELSRIYRTYPNLPQAYFRMSFIYLVSGDLNNARIVLQQLIHRFPNANKSLMVQAQFRLANLESEAARLAGLNNVESRKESAKSTLGSNADGFMKALEEASLSMIKNIPEDAIVAIVQVSDGGLGIASLAVDEVEFNFVSCNKFTVVSRNMLHLIQEEQAFQMSGAVKDEDVVQIGNLSGANVVITGSITKADGANRVILKALDVKTGKIVTMGRASY